LISCRTSSSHLASPPADIIAVKNAALSLSAPQKRGLSPFIRRRYYGNSATASRSSLADKRGLSPFLERAFALRETHPAFIAREEKGAYPFFRASLFSREQTHSGSSVRFADRLFPAAKAAGTILRSLWL
jgi:hypothetical protein